MGLFDGLPDELKQQLRKTLRDMNKAEDQCIGTAQKLILEAFDKADEQKAVAGAMSKCTNSTALSMLNDIESAFMACAMLIRDAKAAAEKDGYVVKPEELHGHGIAADHKVGGGGGN